MVKADEQMFEPKRHHLHIHPDWVYLAANKNGVSRQLLHTRIAKGDPYREAVRPPRKNFLNHKANHEAYENYRLRGLKTMQFHIKQLPDGYVSVISADTLVWCTAKKENGLLKIEGKGSRIYRNDIAKAVNAYLKGEAAE